MNPISTFQCTSRIHIGPGAVARVADEIAASGHKTIFLVTDAGLVKAGIAKRIEDLLDGGGRKVIRFDKVEPDPRLEIAGVASDEAKKSHADIIIGLGGGSALDIAKVAAILVTNGGPLDAYFGIGLVPKPGLKTILVPTTAGTGSEVTPIAILSDEKEKLKKGIVSPYLFPAVAVCDPGLTLGLPPQVTAATGMDALIHAVEAFTSRNATGMTDMLARRAMEMIFANLRTAFANGEDLTARTAMMEGSLLAGMAFANAGVTAVHAFAYPIGAEFHIPHGIANSIMLPPVMAFNMLGNLDKFAQMAAIFGEPTRGLTRRAAALKMVEAIRELAHDLQVPAKLGQYGVTEAHIPALAQGVMKVTRLLANNPRQIRLEDAEAIYRQVL